MTTKTYYRRLSHSSSNSDSDYVKSQSPSDDPDNHVSNYDPKGSPIPADNDFVLDNEDIEDDSDDDDDNHGQSPTHSRSISHSAASPSDEPTYDLRNDSHNGSLADHNQRDEANISEDSQSEQESESSANDDDDDDSSFHRDDADADEEDDDDGEEEERKGTRVVNGVSSRKHRRDGTPEEHVNGDAHDSDSDDMAQQLTPRRTRRANKFIIPEEMRDDDQYFRRSSRSRNVPNRFVSADSTSSIGSDFDFNGETEKLEEEDEEEEESEEHDDDDDDDDDEEFSISRRSRRTTRSRNRSFPSQQRTRGKQSHDDAAEGQSSESGSDGDWRDEGSRRVGRRKRRKASQHLPAKRRRVSDAEVDEATRSARINSRGGRAVNYFESDDEFLVSDEGAGAKESEFTVNPNEPHIEKVLDYRLQVGISPPLEDTVVYSDFEVSKVEFKVKWMSLSFRKCTWETWDTLQSIKGAKRVIHYIKQVESTRDSLLKGGMTPEDIEDIEVAREEYRATLRDHEVVDRVIAKRDNPNDDSKIEYLVKWTKLSYRESTWEDRADLTSKADLEAIDSYIERETNILTSGSKKKYNPFNSKDERPKFKKMIEQPDYLHGEGRTLRDYQLAGLNYMAFSWTKRNNVILADEMGLGKTLQSISFLGWLMYVMNIPGQFLVVVPLSTIEGWRREFVRWLPGMNVVCYAGDGPSRQTIRDYEFYSEEKKVEKFHVLLTTPELMMLDQEYMTDIRWAMIAVDEAHRLKNESSALHITLANLRSANRLLITGTPLQNSIRELWALLHFLNPDVFQNAEEFEDRFSFTALRDPDRVAELHETLRPYIIRRQKGDVEKSLPKKTYSVLRVGMTSAQQQYYRWLLTRNFAKLNASGKGRGMGPAQNIRNLLMELKKCCNHPFLFPNYEDTSTPTSVNDLIRASGKMILLDKLLLRLKEKGHRVLIFSQMVRMLDILQDYCRMRQFPCQRLDGSVENEIRQRAVDHFNAPDSTDFIFLLSTRAGGLGINLATADTVIIFDSDWNPQNDLQAESRAHRIGQKKDVKVFRFLTADTVEEDILERAKRKRVLEHVVIHGVEGGHKSDGKEKEMSLKKEELSAILRFGAEKLFAKDRMKDGFDNKSLDVEASKSDGNESDAPTAKPTSTDEKEAKAEEKRVLAADDIDDMLERAPEDEASQVGAAQPSLGDSLLNAFKWADFTVEEEVDEKEDGGNKKEMAKKAANKIVEMDKEVESVRRIEESEREMLNREGDSEFWNRVIPGEVREDAIANDVVLGTRRRKRPSTFNTDSPDHGKRRRVTRTGRSINGRMVEDEELTDKEKRSLLRALKKFGDPSLPRLILKDAGLENRVESEVATALMNDCLEHARMAVKHAKEGRKDDDDPAYEASVRTAKDARSKQPKILIDVLGESAVDAVDLLKRCEDLKMLRRHIESFDSDSHFRFKNTIKPPSYGNIRWKASCDAMLIVGVYRHGFGNWLRIAQDSDLDLEDKIAVSGNHRSKPGAPDSTKLTRRVITLLRELEKEVQSSMKMPKSRPGYGKVSKEAKTRSRQSKRPPVKLSAKGNKKGDNVKNGGPVTGRDFKRKRLALKKSHIRTLRELHSLSKPNSSVEANEKIKRTKQCLLILGRGIEEHSDSSKAVEVDLWRYVHTVCKTHLAEDRLQAIYKRLSEAEETKD